MIKFWKFWSEVSRMTKTKDWQLNSFINLKMNFSKHYNVVVFIQ